MITSQYIFESYKGITNLDPARLGAQVISGIGFLGAGTIIREGANVRALLPRQACGQFPVSGLQQVSVFMKERLYPQ